MTSDDPEPLQPLDPENDSLASKKGENQSPVEHEGEESDTFEIIEPAPSPLVEKQQSEFADPLIGEPEQEALPDFAPEPEPASTKPKEKIRIKPKAEKPTAVPEKAGSCETKKNTGQKENTEQEVVRLDFREFCNKTCQNGEQVADKLRTLFRFPERNSSPENAQSKVKELFLIVIYFVFGLLYWVYSCLQKVFKYYWDNRKGIWFYLLDWMKHVPPTEVYQREIRLRQEEAEEIKYFKNDVWKIPLSGRCIHCGSTNGCEIHQVVERVENYRFVGIGFLAGILSCLFLSLFYWSFLLFFAAPLVGLITGYLCRQLIQVEIEYSTCVDHHKQTEFPQLRFYGEGLYILVGHKNIRQEFHKELENMGLPKR